MHLPFSLTFSLTGPLGEDVYGCSCMAAFQLYCSAWGVLSSLPQNTSHLSSFSLYKQSKTLKKNHEWKKKIHELGSIVLLYHPFLSSFSLQSRDGHPMLIHKYYSQNKKTVTSDFAE